MDKIKLKINDFELFFNTIQNITKITENLKITIGKNGFVAWIADNNETVRVDIESTSLCIPESSVIDEIPICTKNMHTISQIIGKIFKSHSTKSSKVEPDYSDVELCVSDKEIFIKSSSIKTNIFLENEESVHRLNRFSHELHPILEIKSSIDDIKDIISSTLIFKQSEKIIINVCHQEDMVRNIAYASMSDPLDPRTNSIVVKFGNIVSGDITRSIYIDAQKIRFLSLFQNSEMTIKFNHEPCFRCEFNNNGRNNGFYTSYAIMGKYVLPNKS